MQRRIPPSAIAPVAAIAAALKGKAVEEEYAFDAHIDDDCRDEWNIVFLCFVSLLKIKLISAKLKSYSYSSREKIILVSS